MWFNNLLIYQVSLPEGLDLAESLNSDKLKPCPPHVRFIYGWLPANVDEIVHEIAGAALICLGKEERLLPRSVVLRTAATRIQQLEAQRGFSVKRSERAQLIEDTEFELLPQSFCVQKRLTALFDYTNQRLIINTTSPNQVAQLLALLRKSIAGITLEPIDCHVDLAQRFATWIQHPASLPANFQLATDCLLFALDDDKKRFNCKGYELPADEVLTLLEQGLAPAEISLIWNERIQFTLTHDLQLKRLKCLDYLQDEFNEIHQYDEEYQQRDAALTLLAGELRGLINDLLRGVNLQDKTITSLSTADAVAV